jgi:DNA-binding NtrC family response regulator
MHKVLVVDDDLSYRDLLKGVFAERGYDVRTASESEDAMGVLPHFIPDVLIIDWMLGDQQYGAAVASSTRELNPDVGVVFISGYPSFPLQAAADAAGAIVWLSKPFHLEQIVKAVKRLCEPLMSPSESPQLG